VNAASNCRAVFRLAAVSCRATLVRRRISALSGANCWACVRRPQWQSGRRPRRTSAKPMLDGKAGFFWVGYDGFLQLFPGRAAVNEKVIAPATGPACSRGEEGRASRFQLASRRARASTLILTTAEAGRAWARLNWASAASSRFVSALARLFGCNVGQALSPDLRLRSNWSKLPGNRQALPHELGRMQGREAGSMSWVPGQCRCKLLTAANARWISMLKSTGNCCRARRTGKRGSSLTRWQL